MYGATVAGLDDGSMIHTAPGFETTSTRPSGRNAKSVAPLSPPATPWLTKPGGGSEWALVAAPAAHSAASSNLENVARTLGIGPPRRGGSAGWHRRLPHS